MLTFLTVYRHVDPGGFVLTLELFTCQPPTRELQYGRVLQRPDTIRPLGRNWDHSQYPQVEPNIFPFTAIPDSDPRAADADAAWQREQANNPGNDGGSSGIRRTLHLPREEANFTNTLPCTYELFGTSVVNAMRVSDDEKKDVALYFIVSVRVFLSGAQRVLLNVGFRTCRSSKKDSE